MLLTILSSPWTLALWAVAMIASQVVLWRDLPGEKFFLW